MIKFLWGMTLIACVFGIVHFVTTAVGAPSAPQQAAGAAVSIAIVLIPYIVTCCIAQILKPDIAPVRIVTPEEEPQPVKDPFAPETLRAEARIEPPAPRSRSRRGQAEREAERVERVRNRPWRDT